jgi:hypothetical protein
MDREELSQMIHDYQMQNGIEIITEEELLDIAESDLYPHIVFSKGAIDFCDSFRISDYEFQLLQSGFDPFTEELLDIQLRSDFHFIGVDVIYEGFVDKYESMKYDDPEIDEIEWESALADDLEYYASLRSKTLEVTAANNNELIDLLESQMDETTYCLKIHWRFDNLNFLIRIIDEEQFYWYTVFLDFNGKKGTELKYLGSDECPGTVLRIIDYYLETGLTIKGYQYQ